MTGELHRCTRAALIKALNTTPAPSGTFRIDMRERRLKHRITTAELADVSGYSSATISRWESPHVAPHAKIDAASVRNWIMALNVLVAEVRKPGFWRRNIGATPRRRHQAA